MGNCFSPRVGLSGFHRGAEQCGCVVVAARGRLHLGRWRTVDLEQKGRYGSCIPSSVWGENRASSVYKGLSLSLNRRLANEIEFSSSYTISKAIDDASDFNEQPENPYMIRAERALSSNDQRHRFVLSGTFDLPFGDEEETKTPPGVIAKVSGNIEVAPILIIGSGRPINPLTGFDANRSGAFPPSARPLGFGRNSLITPSQLQFDLRVLKFFKIGEHGKLDFVVESLNVLNHTNVVALNQFYGPENSPIPGFTTPNKAGIPRQLQFSIGFEF